MTEITFLVPSVSDVSRIQCLERELASRHGGFTFAGLARGHWKGIEEYSREYRVAVPTDESESVVEWIVDYVKLTFSQEAVYITTRNAEIL